MYASLAPERNPPAIFLWLPKCAGTSVAQLCREAHVLIDPMTFEELHYDDYVNADAHPDAFTFAFVRNPWDRVVSSYAMFAGERRPAAIPAPSFREFLDIVEHEPLAKRPYEHEIWFIPERYAELTPDELSVHFRRTVKNHTAAFTEPFYKLFDVSGAQRASFIGRYERLDADVARVFGALGLPATSVPHLHAGERESYERYYDTETRTLVGRIFADEIAHFGYTFGSAQPHQ